MQACSSAKKKWGKFGEILYCFYKGRTLQDLSRKCTWLTLRFLLRTKIRPGHHTKFVHCALKLSKNGRKANQNTCNSGFH